MRTSINQTGRSTILRDKLQLSIQENGNLLFSWDLEQINFREEFESILEISTIGGVYRFLIPIAQEKPKDECSLDISKVFEPKTLVGRLKIVATDQNGIRFLKAESKLLRLSNDKLEGDQGRSLLDVYYDQTLKIPWQLIFEDSEPVLKVSNYYENATKIYSHTLFQTNILSEIVRQIMFWLLTEDPDPSENSKIELWWNFAEQFGLDAETRSNLTSRIERDQDFLSEVLMISQEISDAFASRNKMLEILTNYIEDEMA